MIKNDDPTFGELLRLARETAGLSQTQLAARISSTQQQIQRWERDENDPKASSILRLCNAVDREPNYLFGFNCEDDKHPRVIYYREKLNKARRALN